MEPSSKAPTPCSSCWARSWCWRCTPASPFSSSARCARRTRSMRWSRSWSTSRSRPSPTSSSAMRSPTASASSPAPQSLAAKNGYELVKFFFLLTFAAAIPAIVSGGIAERARFGPQLAATALLVGAHLSAVRRRRLGRHVRLAGAGSRHRPAPSSTTSPAASSCMPSAAGSAWPRCCCSARAATATARTARSARTRRRASRSWRSAPGCCRSAGSAST